jgi:hypothetical protein
MKRYAPPKPAPLPEDYDEFYATLTPAEKELDELAKQMLASSYFIQWSHMYLKWSKAKADQKAKALKEAEEKKE